VRAGPWRAVHCSAAASTVAAAHAAPPPTQARRAAQRTHGARPHAPFRATAGPSGAGEEQRRSLTVRGGPEDAPLDFKLDLEEEPEAPSAVQKFLFPEKEELPDDFEVGGGGSARWRRPLAGRLAAAAPRPEPLAPAKPTPFPPLLPPFSAHLPPRCPFGTI
jgi:hypothetical protein